MSRRALLAGAAGLSAAAALAPIAARAQVAAPEVMPLEREDYAEARRRFRTNLVSKGPSPEKSDPLGTPPGSRRILYRGGPEGSIDLVAWLSPYEATSTPKPAVVFLHGGNATGDGHWELVRPYAEAGYVVIHPSFRGENGQDGNYSGFYDETSDALAAAHYLEDLPGIDRNRIFLSGHSNGGTLSLLAAMAHEFRAAAPISAGVNPWRYFGRFEPDVRFDANDPREFVMRASVCFAPSLKCPTYLLRGSEERPFDADHQLLIERVRSAGTKIDTKILPGSHNGVVPGAVQESIRFFNQFS